MRGLNSSHHDRFEVDRNEILAIFGLMGSGGSEIFERLFGLVDDMGGDMVPKGRPIHHSRRSRAHKSGHPGFMPCCAVPSLPDGFEVG